ncbi:MULTISPECIES: FUSC family protein [unclassified Streptomyces]|uniref:FUSC family protein n=1 Tax=unclassified Streptomyces TaxID=2593676 RepID=UPI001F39B480|nr:MULTISPECIES: FUSC family protein [unclassified Streptomyces]WKE73162.1 FUSC family protein [Streptomyces sp. WP-1]
MSGVPAGVIPAPYAAPARRAVQVTLVAAAGFYLFRYGLDRPVAATYALFAAVALGGLARIPGTGRQRAEVVLRLIPVGWLLVIVGTYLSVRTWSAVLGMLAVGFALAFSAVGGPRPAGAAPGLQLLYILPSFPPYDPGQLGDRLLGTTTGTALLVLAEALLFPEPTPPPYRARAAHAAAVAGRCTALLAAPPYTLSRAEIRTAREAGHRLRSLTVPEADRPAGPGVRDRALSHTCLATRALLSRLPRLSAMSGGEIRPLVTPGGDVRPPAAPRCPPDPVATAVLDAVARLATATAGCLRAGASPLVPYKELAAARAVLSARSAAHPGEEGETPAPDVLRRHAAVLEVADAALAMGAAADLAVHGRRASVTGPPERFWYATARAPALWWHRVRGHAGRRSVFFQNAVRIALALTAARLVAGVDTLPHGFWATLATLTLTRTTMDETWSTIRSALAGTLAGALITGGTLALVSTHTNVYAVLLPLWMLFAFTVGPVKGVGWAQGLFTVLVALVFAQLAPPTWRLAEVRLLDVLVGSAIGAVFGLLAWPRGAHDELRYAAAELLRRAAEIVVATSASVALEGPLRREGQAVVPAGMPGHRSLQHAVILAESAYGQFQSEPTPFGGRGHRPVLPGVDWQAALMAGHHTLWGSERLLEPPCTGLGPTATAVSGLGDRVAGRMLLVSAALDPGGDTPTGPVPRLARSLAGADAEPPGAPRLYYATVSWLDSLMADLSRITRAGGELGVEAQAAGEGRPGGTGDGPEDTEDGAAGTGNRPAGTGDTAGGPRAGPAGPGPVRPP